MCYLAAEAEHIKWETKELRLLLQLEAQQAKDGARGMSASRFSLSVPLVNHAILGTVVSQTEEVSTRELTATSEVETSDSHRVQTESSSAPHSLLDLA